MIQSDIFSLIKTYTASQTRLETWSSRSMIAIKQRRHQSLTSFFSSSTDGLSPSTSQCVINKPLRCWNSSQLECRDDSSVVVTRLCFHCATHWPVNTPRLCSSSPHLQQQMENVRIPHSGRQNPPAPRPLGSE